MISFTLDIHITFGNFVTLDIHVTFDNCKLDNHVTLDIHVTFDNFVTLDSCHIFLALGNNEDELSPLPRRVGVKKQESYQRAILKGGVGSFSGSFNAGESTDRPPGMLLRQEALERNSKGPSPSTSKRGSFKKQDSYNR